MPPDPIEVAIEIVASLLIAGCCVVASIRWRGSAAGILAGIAFGLLFLVHVWFLMLYTGAIYYYSRAAIAVPNIILMGAYAMIMASFLIAPKRSAPVPEAAPDYPPNAPDLPAPTRRPGWGLVTAWIIVSAFGLVSAIVTLIIVMDAGSYHSNSESEAILISAAVCGLISIAGSVLYVIWLYQAWDSVPKPYRSASPGQAVGFLFLPFFNFYWVFRAVPGLSASIRRAMMAYEKRYEGGAGYGIGIAACVVALVPYVNLLAWPLFLIWVCLANSARNRLLRLGRPV